MKIQFDLANSGCTDGETTWKRGVGNPPEIKAMEADAFVARLKEMSERFGDTKGRKLTVVLRDVCIVED